MVGDTGIRHTVGVADIGGECAADFVSAGDADRAFVIGHRGLGDVFHIQRRAGRFFCCALGVGIFGVHADFVPGIVAGETVGRASFPADGLAVTQPLVLHIIRRTIAVADLCGEGLPDFHLAADGDFARVIGLRI